MKKTIVLMFAICSIATLAFAQNTETPTSAADHTEKAAEHMAKAGEHKKIAADKLKKHVKGADKKETK